ncbi:RHS repeat protein [Endozoicomonas sp. SM1973]|uniref:RHS repeat protein n=1 Tax=Spartinivicinus marinus TaxID=2994442 RepID=A0A853I9H3_9GAMM|nr:RHS repeat protein [Spartinivicinus marinus]MCX4026346.1 RHS repeat protein [Spartinivicinus marinus]NYZ67308.1 RHS repeat protein [Spartinivicinus marinus]
MKFNRIFSALLAAGLAFSAQANTSLERKWLYQYDNQGNITQIDGPRTDVQDISHYEYDEKGNLIKTINALGHTTELKDHNYRGSPQTLIDANGVVTKITYNHDGAAETFTVKSKSGDITTRFAYDNVGQVTQITLPNSSVIKYEYSPARYLMAIENSLGERIEYEYDNAGNKTKQTVKSATGEIVSQQNWVYDELSRLLRSVGANEQTTQHEYDVNDNLVGFTNPNNNKTTHGFDALNRLTQTTDALEGVTRLEYNQQDQITKVVDPKGTTTQYEYDVFGRLIKRVSPDTGTTTYEYDLADNITKRTDARGEVTEYTYDALNRLTKKTYPSASELTIEYLYDDTSDNHPGIGKLTGVKDAKGVIAYQYDDRGNIVNLSRTIETSSQSIQQSIGYQYNINNQLTQVTYPSHLKVNYQRNNEGQITGVTAQWGAGETAQTIELAKNITNQAFGPMTSLTWGNGLTLNRQFNLDSQLTQQTIAGLQQLNYKYDPNGNITEIAKSETEKREFTYDPLDHLLKEVDGFKTTEYTYDAVGNRLSKKERLRDMLGLQEQTYAENSNRIATTFMGPVRIDAAGNTTGNGPLNFEYAANNRLSKVKEMDFLLASYHYNAIGERVHKTIHYGPEQPTHWIYTYNETGQILAETKYNKHWRQQLTRQYIWLGSLPLAMVEQTANGKSLAAPQVTYLHSDHLNTPRLATNQQQQTVWAWDSDAFGVGEASEDVDGNGQKTVVSLRFPGQLADEESGLFYNYFRDYDPTLGRYIESDPIGLKGGLNTYTYVSGNPLIYKDPLGLAQVCWSYNGNFPHKYICVQNKCAGNWPWEEDNPNRSCPQGGITLPDKKDDALFCTEDKGGDSECEKSAFDQCVLVYIGTAGQCSAYDAITNNCIHWVNNVRTICKNRAKQQCSKK